ncbi:MAG: hypothetical protein DRJ50_12375 [Actinobacteria bacterium]|nr:MAG: hypothetical protein DRJ50_12375 [Actinomycetota bacterium]
MRLKLNTTRTGSAAILAAILVLTACGSDSSSEENLQEQSEIAFREQMTTIDDAVASWGNAKTIEDAQVGAETAANLVVGPNGPGYGDRNGDGTIDGETDVGVLSGIDGTPTGIAQTLDPNECIERDVLGGSWTDPAAEWDKMTVAIAEWTPDNNTMPTLDSHLMRIVGWSTFTLDTDSLDEAREYAGHAKLHVDVSLDALNC